MASKAEISWKRRKEDGERVAVYAKRVGDQWKFFMRDRRYDQWQAVAEPPLEDWLELLDAVQRRINRRLVRPEEEARVKKRSMKDFRKQKSRTRLSVADKLKLRTRMGATLRRFKR